MKHRTSLIVAAALLLSFLDSPSLAAEEGVVLPGAEVQKLAGEYSFTEGPVADPDGNVYFTDQPNDRIMKWNTSGEVTTFMQPAGRSNGLYFDRKGNLLACADEKNELWQISPAGQVTVLLKDYQGGRFNGPNDLWVRPDNGIYFTDPFYKRPYWDHETSEQDKQAVYFLSPDRSRLVRVAEDLVQPNGIIGTPDGKRLYVADIGAGKTYSYRIEEDGNLSEKTLFCELGSDGMTLDSEGNVYLTGRGVTVYDSTGAKIDHIAIPEPWTANVTFGGAGHDMIFITASKGIYGVKARVRGIPATLE